MNQIFELEITAGKVKGIVDLPDVGNGEPPPGGGVSELFWTPILWKAKGVFNHPSIGDGDLSGRAQMIGDKVVELDVYLELGSTTTFGDIADYYFFQAPDLMPDLDVRPQSGAGSVLGWTGGADLWPGSCWWSAGPGGELKYGIRCSFGTRGEFGRSKPGLWEKDDRLRLSIRYEVQ